METLTIPKKLTQKGDLVVIPRKEYEELLRVQKQRKNTTRLKPIDAEKNRHPEFYAQLDKDLNVAIKDYKAGRAYGPFESVEESRLSLESRRNKKK